MKQLSRMLGFVAVLVTSAITVSGPARAAIINLGFALDSSGSIDGDWGTITGGLSTALGNIPIGGPDTYRVGVVTFSSSGTETSVYTDVINSAGKLSALQSAVSSAAFLNGATCISCGTTLLTNNFTTAFGAGALTDNTSIMNISTDGFPNGDPITNGTTLQGNLVTDGWNAISAEAIGTFDLSFLDDLVYPQPAFDTSNPGALPDPLTQGFVLQIASAADFPGAINAKIQRIVNNETPLPGALPMFVSGLGAVGGLLWRRKRKARAATA